MAIGLARSLLEAFPSAPEVAGLLALLLLHDARRGARLNEKGEAVPLPEQDRARWDSGANLNNGTSFDMRVGMNTGPVVAGVIGTHKFIFDLWGDAVNVASRMESHGEPGRIQVTEASWLLLRDRYRFEERGVIPIKGKGLMRTYFLVGRQNGPREGPPRIS